MPWRGSVRIGRLAGIPIGVHPLWLAIVALLTVELGAAFYPDRAPGLAPAAAYGLGLASALALFAGILAHELGHAIAARRRGVEIEEIDLWLLGGVARMSGEPRRAGDELRFALAGPAVTLVLLAVTLVLRLAAAGAPDWVRAFLDYQAAANAAIVAFNLLPAFPLDGGRVARALLWWRLDDHDRATELAAHGGRAIGFALVGLGLLGLASGVLGALWPALVGAFLIVATTSEARQSQARRLLGCRVVKDLMSSAPVTLPAVGTLADAFDAIKRTGYGGFPVVDRAGVAVGIVTTEDVRTALAAGPADTPLAWIVRIDPQLLADPGTPVAEMLDRPAFLAAGRAVVVDAGGRPTGLVSATDVLRVLQARPLSRPGGQAPGTFTSR
jgi:Zn-dependent protease/CBS domain-containing protein